MKVRRHYDLAERPAKEDKFKAILLVDDDRELVQTLQWMLADENFMVDKAYDGEEALRRAVRRQHAVQLLAHSRSAAAGFALRERLTVYPEYVRRAETWIDPRVWGHVSALADPDSGLAH